jgi:GNAT superfamily N-acetyltransferase
MSTLIVLPVRSRREQKQFFQLPWQLYRHDPNWIPPLRQNQMELLNFRPHPFYDENEIQTFLALRDGQPVGRIAAILNNAHNKQYGERRGFFGFFETIDDAEVAAGLFAAVRAWFAERQTFAVRGPTNPSQNYECGLLIDGFDSPPTFMMTYNPPYYARLIEGCGFQKAQDLYAFWGNVDMLEGLDKKMVFIIEETKRRFGVVLRHMERARFHEEVQTFVDIYNRSLVGTWGYAPMSAGEVRHMAKALTHLIVPELTSVAEVGGKPVGSVFGLLDYNPRIKKIDGRLFPFGFLRLLMNKRAITTTRLISTNVVPEYQKWGLGLALLGSLLPRALAWGIRDAEFSWVLESNHLSFKSLQRGGAKLTKSYRIYDWETAAGGNT